MRLNRILSVLSVSFLAFQALGQSDNLSPERRAFEQVYKSGVWGKGSGLGSAPRYSLPYLFLLQGLLAHNDVQTIVDFGCGDWQLMSTITLPVGKIYKGFDLVESIIQSNVKKYSQPQVTFTQLNNLEEFSTVEGDLLIVKDVLHHWPTEKVQFFLEKMLPHFKYALIVNDFKLPSNKKELKVNGPIEYGEWRALDLQEAPFDKWAKNMEVLMDYPSHGAIKRVYLYINPQFSSQEAFVESWSSKKM